MVFQRHKALIPCSRLASVILVVVVSTFYVAKLVGQNTSTQALSWQDYRSEEGQFTVKFPGTPKVTVSELEGPLKITRHTHTFDLKEISFDLEYMDLKPGADPDAAMEGGASGLIESMTARGATVLLNRTITRGSCTGREITLSTPIPGVRTRGFTHSRIFVSGMRFYTLVFVTRVDSESNRDVGRTFLDSFAVNGGCTSMIAPVEKPSTNRSEEIVEGKVDSVTGWRTIENPALGVSVLMPGAARHISERPQVDPFPLMHHTYIYSENGTVYSAEMIGDYPPGFHTTPSSYQTSIDIALYAVTKNLGAAGFELKPSRDLRLASFPGREFWLHNEKENSQGRAQIYVTTKRTYIFIAFTGVLNPLSPLSRFFSSIRISPN